MVNASGKGKTPDSSRHLNTVTSSETKYSEVKLFLNLPGLPASHLRDSPRPPRSHSGNYCHRLQIIYGGHATVDAGFVPRCMMAAAKMAK